MRDRVDGRAPALISMVIVAALGLLLAQPGRAGAQGTDPPTTAPSTTVAVTTTVAGGSTTTRPVTTTAPPPTTAPPTTAPPEEEAPPVTAPPSTRRVTTTVRVTTTTRPAATTTSTSTSTSTTVVATTTTRAAAVTSSTLPPDTTKGNETRAKIDRIVRALFVIAGLAALLGIVYAWHTSPRRRVRIAEQRAARAAQRLDDAVAASFMGTALGGVEMAGAGGVVVGRGGPADAALDDDEPADDAGDADADGREGLVSKLFPRREGDEDERPNPRPDPRPRPNDEPWE